MDPISADFARLEHHSTGWMVLPKISKTCCEIYQTGLSAANTDPEERRPSFRSRPAPPSKPAQRSANLVTLAGPQDSAKRCTVAAGDLQVAISKLETDSMRAKSPPSGQDSLRQNEIGRLDRLERKM